MLLAFPVHQSSMSDRFFLMGLDAAEAGRREGSSQPKALTLIAVALEGYRLNSQDTIEISDFGDIFS